MIGAAGLIYGYTGMSIRSPSLGTAANSSNQESFQCYFGVLSNGSAASPPTSLSVGHFTAMPTSSGYR